VANVGPMLALHGERGEGDWSRLGRFGWAACGKDKRRWAGPELTDSMEYGPKLVLIIKSLSNFCKHFSILKTILNLKQI
jgi:hypothetical protein